MVEMCDQVCGSMEKRLGAIASIGMAAGFVVASLARAGSGHGGAAFVGATLALLEVGAPEAAPLNRVVAVERREYEDRTVGLACLADRHL